MSDKTQYFASLSGREFTSAAFEKINAYYNHLNSSGRLKLYQRLLNYYNVGFERGGALLKGGDQDEFTMIDLNHFRNMIQHMHTMTITQRPSFEPRATNTDYKSKAQTIVARSVLDYYNKDKHMGDKTEHATEYGLLLGETETVVEWNSTIGKDYMPGENGKTIKEGDIEFKNFTPVDAIRDVTLRNASKMQWRIYRDFVNKFDLAANFPEHADRIIRLDPGQGRRSLAVTGCKYFEESETVPVFVLYHDRTPAVPMGRRAVFIDELGPLMDGGLPYDFFPGFRLAPSETDGTPFGYSLSFDLLPIQEAIDLLASAVVTNQANFGVQNILLPNGCNISLEQLADGLNAIYYDVNQGKPEPLNLTNTPAEIFKMIDKLERTMEIISGVNSVARGDPAASLKSGVALALVQSMAIQFNSNLQKAYARHVENVGTALIRILGKFPKNKRTVEIAGKANRTYLKEFEPKDIEGISRVTVDLGNPLSRTTAGKVQMAEDLLKNKLIDSADQYIQVLTTGTLEPLIEGKQAELMLIASENEMMSEGQKPSVAITDFHTLHIQEHKVVMASPEARKRLEVIQSTTAHITEHITMLEKLSVSNPNLLLALGQQPVQAPQPPAPPPGGGTGNTKGVIDPTAPVVKDASKVGHPGMPKNPMTGQKVAAPLPPNAA